MAAQQGFQYEINASDVLKKMNFVPKDFVPAGAGHEQPDLVIMKGSKKSGCELKITDASAGSLVLKYDVKKKKWGFDPASREDKEKAFIMDLADSVNLFRLINASWKEVPYKVDREYQDELWKNSIGKIPTQKRYERDLATFSELKGSIPAVKIEEYYNKKATFYVNVGTHGFYLFGSRNPLGFKGVPMFSQSADAGWRARVQYKGAGNYQFTFEMNFRMRTKSPFNIAPITKTSVTILKNNIVLPV